MKRTHCYVWLSIYSTSDSLWVPSLKASPFIVSFRTLPFRLVCWPVVVPPPVRLKVRVRVRGLVRVWTQDWVNVGVIVRVWFRLGSVQAGLGLPLGIVVVELAL